MTKTKNTHTDRSALYQALGRATPTDMLAYEDGEMTEEQEIAFYQDLINSGQAWQLQGSYGRTAMSYIEAGLCLLGEQGHTDYWGNYVPSRYEVKPGTKGSEEYCEKMQATQQAA